MQWPGQGDLGWDLGMEVFSIMLVAITIALDDVDKRLSKLRPENPPALDSSSREVDSRVEALRFDLRAGALALHFCGFSNRCARSLFFFALGHFRSFLLTLLYCSVRSRASSRGGRGTRRVLVGCFTRKNKVLRVNRLTFEPYSPHLLSCECV